MQKTVNEKASSRETRHEAMSLEETLSVGCRKHHISATNESNHFSDI